MNLLRPKIRLPLALFALLAASLPAASRPNLLVITSDDLSCDSVGAYGCKLADTTPHLDRFARQALRFTHAYVQVGNCMPSRNVMFSGRYPHNNRVEGFYMVRDISYPVMADLLKAAGYYTGIRHKVAHSTPYSPYPAWDVVLDTMPDGTVLHQKNPESYYLCTRRAIAEAKQAGRPFCLNLNISDPHKPFYGEDGNLEVNKPSRVFTAAEVPVPGFLFDDPGVRGELAQYYSSVRRGDDSFGAILRALREAGEEDRTAIVYLSDHGMPLPFAKTQLYFHSTRTPLMIRWPGLTRPGTVDDRHLISAVDLLPTLLDLVGQQHPPGLDGRSFAPLLRGETQDGRDYMVAEYNENSGGFRHPMRSIITREYGYLFNPWSNGTRVMATATRGTVSFRRLAALAPSQPALAARLDLFEHRVPEELYHYRSDPDALHNRIADPAHRAERDRLIALLEAWMVRTNDPMLAVFRQRDDPAAREAYMRTVEQEASARQADNPRKGKAAKKKAGKRAD